MKTILKKNLLFFGILLCSVAFILYSTGIESYFNIEFIHEHQQSLMNFIHAHYTAAVILYIVLYAVLIVCMLSFTLFLTTLGGFLFTALPGTCYSVIAALIGSTTSFLLIRYFLYRWVSDHYHDHLEKFSTKFKRHGIMYLLMLYFFPLTPYAFINILAGLSDIPLLHFVATTALGILPITYICSFAGEKLATITSLNEIISTPILLALTLLSVLTVVPTIVRYFVQRNKKHNTP